MLMYQEPQSIGYTDVSTCLEGVFVAELILRQM